MKRGFYTIMSAQFCSSLADNALFVVAVELLRTSGAAEWQRAALVPMFALFYVLLAPFVGAFADALPKGRVMLISNAIKVVGCLMMLFGHHPLIAYAVIGLGAAAYSPAKYGILTELLPASQLVKANGWIEGLTITSIILGVLVGGQLVGPTISQHLLGFDFPYLNTGVDTPAEAAIALLILIYVVAAWFNLHIPLTGVAMRPLREDPNKSLVANLLGLLPDFWQCSKRLWADKLGQISLSTTTLFWGVSGNLRYIVLAWAAVALGYGTTQASALVGVVALGTAAGAILAAMRMRLQYATRTIPLGIGMGLLVLAMNFINELWLAVPFLILLGGLGGYLVVPMNALLQHRGHILMGAGHSIAVQNFNENLSILVMTGLYAFLIRSGFSINTVVVAFGLFVAGTMYLVKLRHEANQRQFDSVAQLDDIRH